MSVRLRPGAHEQLNTVVASAETITAKLNKFGFANVCYAHFIRLSAAKSRYLLGRVRLSWSELLCGEGVVAVAGAMDAFVFLPQVKAPVWF